MSDEDVAKLSGGMGTGKEPTPAWQPFTFGGVAAFGGGRWGRLAPAQAVTAALVAASVVWFLGHAYAPVITQAIQNLPDGARIANGRLAGVTNVLLSETKLLSIAVAENDEAEVDQSADVQVALRHERVEVSSLLSSALGSLKFDYGSEGTLDLSRSHLEPWWGAWEPVFLAEAGVGTVLVMWVFWGALALVYAPAAKFMAWFCDRKLSWPGAWRLASAALLPGALLMAAGILCYGGRLVDLIGLSFFGVVHILVGWVYLLVSPGFGARLTVDSVKRNPFVP